MNKLFITTAVIGALSLSATAVMANHHGEGGGQQKGKMMSRMDTDGNGSVSKQEFMAKHSDKFGQIDADGNGTLSKEELRDAHGKMKEKRQERKQERKSSQE